MGKYLDKKLVWQRLDGGVSVTHLHEDDMREGESEDQFIERYTQRLIPAFDGVIPVVMNKTDIPSDRADRNKWRVQGGKVKVDKTMVTSSELKKENKDKAKLKLKSLGLSDDEIKGIVE